jgi:hypothetical protein
MTWHNMMEISWHTIMEIEWHSIQEIRWHNMMEIRHLRVFLGRASVYKPIESRII